MHYLKNKKYNQIIWDWNGTLLDDVGLSINLINEFLKQRNKPIISIEKYKEIFDFPVRDYYLRAGFDFSIETFEKVGLEYCNQFEVRIEECALHKNAEKILEYLNKKNIKQAILSSTEQCRLEKMVKYYKIEKYFEKVIGQHNYYAEGKVEVGNKYLEEQKIVKEETILIGDTSYDAYVASKIKEFK